MADIVTAIAARLPSVGTASLAPGNFPHARRHAQRQHAARRNEIG
ncbi:hypothetical protein RGU70_01195 [Herbaspirillum sp. RTI4]|nr:hypothetical protein [Herbaspirillum sp. RTI4]MDY7576943.1 hypothetical protein [Herbaspirillum sp. RTI4]MEA9982155.1 hypothetical protein [Herbaspirillum sp. RTI4]